MTVGERIKQRRLELGLTQEELALKMGYKGKTSVCVAETKGNNVTTTKVKKFAKALNVSVQYLLGDLDDTNYPPEDTPEAKAIREYWKNPPHLDEQRKEEFIALYENVPADVQEAVVNLLKSYLPKV